MSVTPEEQLDDLEASLSTMEAQLLLKANRAESSNAIVSIESQLETLQTRQAEFEVRLRTLITRSRDLSSLIDTA